MNWPVIMSRKRFGEIVKQIEIHAFESGKQYGYHLREAHGVALSRHQHMVEQYKAGGIPQIILDAFKEER